MTLEDLEDLNDLQMYSESVSATVCSPRAIPLQVLLFSFYARLKKKYYTAPTAAWLGLQNRPHHMLALQEPSPLCQRPANARLHADRCTGFNHMHNSTLDDM
jgi:hypothetical protein